MSYPFVEAKWYTKTNGRQIDLIVIHTMEAPEKGTTAESVAAYFAKGTVKASAHYNIDNDSIVQSVLEKDVAYHAPGANHNGVGLEHAGYAGQGKAGWEDAYSTAMLQRSATLSREIAARHAIPHVWLWPADLRAGKRGFTLHHNVSLAFGKSEHWDPGPDFPIASYMALVRATPAIDGVDDMKLIKDSQSPKTYLKHGERLSYIGDINILNDLQRILGTPELLDPKTIAWLASVSD